MGTPTQPLPTPPDTTPPEPPPFYPTQLPVFPEGTPPPEGGTPPVPGTPEFPIVLPPDAPQPAPTCQFQPRWVQAFQIMSVTHNNDGTITLGLSNNVSGTLNLHQQGTLDPTPPVVGDYYLIPSEGHAWTVPQKQMLAPCYCRLCPEDFPNRIQKPAPPPVDGVEQPAPAPEPLDWGPWYGTSTAITDNPDGSNTKVVARKTPAS